jgi:transposase
MPKVKLKEAEVKEIVRLRKEGLLMLAIAKRFAVSKECVRSILCGHTWKRVTNQTGLPPVSGQGWTKLKDADLAEVRRLRGKGLSYRAIAKHLGDIVTYQQIHRIISGKSRVA